jgi:predicted CoA-binding protein
MNTNASFPSGSCVVVVRADDSRGRGIAAKQVPVAVAEFLRGRRIAVAGVSRSSNQPANAVFRKLRDSGYEAIPINPRAATVEGAICYPDLASVPGASTAA